jgi:hypothetical protein
MNVPTVNVVMTYNPQKMMNFQQTGSLTAFKELGDEDVQVFSNSPNSNFISLTHDFNYDGGGGEGGDGNYPKIELEFIDPKGLFDHNLDFSPHTLLDPKDDLILQALKKKEAELQQFQQAKQGTAATGFAELLQNKADLGWVTDRINTLEADIKALKSYDDGATDEDSTKLAFIEKQINAYNSTLGQPVWITYGVGDDLKDWCPPLCFNQVTMVEFSFDATKGRTMKLIYGGDGEKHPNLTSMGILPLGALGIGAVFNGSSRRLFSKEAAAILKEDYGYTAGKDVSKPSLHKIITDTLKSFLQNTTNDMNVMVLFPNLDMLLANYYKQEWESVKSSNADLIYTNDAEKLLGYRVWHIEATREVLEGLGFTMSCSRNSYKGRMGDSIFNELERQVDDIAVSNWVLGTTAGTPASPDSVIAWLEDRDFRCELSTNGIVDTVKDMLESVGDKLSDKIATTHKDPKAFQVGWYYETDFNVLQILHEFGLIKDQFKPALIFGEMNTIRDVLEGRYFEDTALASDEDPSYDAFDNTTTPGFTSQQLIEDKLKTVLSFFDIEDGYSFNLMKDLYEVEMPIPWLGPFGPTANNDIENFIPEDTNLVSTEYNTIKSTQPNRFDRMPIFSFGTRNPNILNFDMDINKQYTKLLGTFNYANISSFNATTAILGKDTKAAQDACTLLSKVVEFQNINITTPTDKYGIPIEFKTLIAPYWEQRQGSTGGTLTKFDDWEEVFTILIPGLELDDDFKSYNDFVSFLWSTFCSLTQGDVPRSKLRQRGVNSIKEMLNRHTFIANRLSMEGYLGTIKTVPMFHLSNVRRAVNRQAVVLGVEPKFTGTDANAWVPEATWFSGLYLLNGFKHTITKSGVYSEFAVNKPLSTGGFLKSWKYK